MCAISSSGAIVFFFFFLLFVCCSASNSKWIWYEFAYFSYTLRYTERENFGLHSSTPPLQCTLLPYQTTLAHTYSLLVAYVTMNDAFGIMECNVDERPHRTSDPLIQMAPKFDGEMENRNTNARNKMEYLSSDSG